MAEINGDFNGPEADNLTGTPGNDTINGIELNDTLSGGGGNDIVDGGNHDDILHGDADNDTVIGRGGDDTVFGDLGNDSLSGGELGDDSVSGGSGNDTIFVGSPDDLNDTLDGGSGDDSIRANGHAFVQGGSGNDTVDLGLTLVQSGSLLGGSGNLDLLILSGQVVFDTANFNAQSAGFERLEVKTQAFGGNGDNTLSFLGLKIENNGFLRIDGGAGNDRITGTNFQDTLGGGGGNDTLIGAFGADALNGLALNDRLDGGGGNDTLSGFGGDPLESDTLLGGAGNDRLNLSGVSVAIGGAGNDTVRTNGALVHDGAILGDDPTGPDPSAIDLLHVETNTVFATSFFDAAAAGFDRLIIEFILRGDDSANVLDFSGITAVDDHIPNISGEGGDDVISAPNASTAAVGVSDDLVAGGSGNDTLFGNDGDDTLDGGSHDDELQGGAGEDRLFDAFGANTVDGGTGNDVLDIQGSGRAIGGRGSDTVVVGDFTVLQGQLLGDDANGVADPGNVDSLIVGQNTLFSVASFFANAAGFERVNAGAEIIGSGVANTLDFSTVAVGVFVPTSLTGLRFVGNNGNDNILGPSGPLGNDTLHGNRGNDTLRGMGGNDLIFGDENNDSLEGGIGDDSLDGGTGTDRLLGGDGHDTLIKRGSSFASGEDGNDTIRLIDALANGANVLGGAGVDTFFVGGFGGTQFRVFDALAQELERFGGGGSILGTGGNDMIDLEGVFNASGAQGFVGGGGGNDRMFVGLGAWRFDGNGGNDIVTVTSGGQVQVNLGDGDDVANWFKGAGTYDGNPGADEIRFGQALAGVNVDLSDASSQALGNGNGSVTLNGFENATGSNFDDVLLGNAGANDLDGGAGHDHLIGGLGSNTLIGGAGLDTADYSSLGGAVTLNLGAGSATGTGFGDVLNQIENAVGTPFDDVLRGSAGINVLTPGRGADIVTGGAGGDILDINAVQDSPTADPDAWTDFVSGIDDIDVSSVDAIPGGPDNPFFWKGTGAFTGAGQARFEQAGGHTFVEFNISGTLAPEIAVDLFGNITVVRGDLIL